MANGDIHTRWLHIHCWILIVRRFMTLLLMAELMDWWVGVWEGAVIGCGRGFGQCSRSGVECRPISSCRRVRGPMVTGRLAGRQDTTGARTGGQHSGHPGPGVDTRTPSALKFKNIPQSFYGGAYTTVTELQTEDNINCKQKWENQGNQSNFHPFLLIELLQQNLYQS